MQLSTLPNTRRWRHVRPYGIAALAALISPCALAAPTLLYASPNGNANADCLSAASPCSLGTVQGKARASAVNMTGNVIVNLQGGDYWLTAPFKLNETDSGTNGYSVIYRTNPASTSKATFSGGVAVTGWVPHQNNIWKATLPVGTQDFRQVYVNGVRAIRARYPNQSSDSSPRPFLAAYSPVEMPGAPPQDFVVANPPAGLLPGDASLAKVEVVWLSHWMHKRARISQLLPNTPVAGRTTIRFQAFEANSEMIHLAAQNDTPYFFENAYQLLDAPGEHYYDKSSRTLYYIPRANETLNQTGTTVIIPQRETLVEVAGLSATSRAHHIEFRGMKFQHSNWTAPDTKGYLNGQAGLRDVTEVLTPGAILIRNADHITLEDNEITATGAHGVLLTGQLSKYRIVHNILRDLSAGGIYDVSGNSANIAALSPSASSYGLISGNLIEKAGRHYSDGIGILATTPNNLNIEFNEVRNIFYTGIHLGWRWDFADVQAYSNRISHNLVTATNRLHGDGAAIYTLGNMGTTADGQKTRIENNDISLILTPDTGGGFPAVGIYLDEGSQNKVIANNVISSVSLPFKFMSTAKDNIFQGNVHSTPIDTRAMDTAQNTFDISSNRLVETPSSDPVAAAIMQGARRVKNRSSEMTASSPYQWNTDYSASKAIDQSTDEAGWSSTPSDGVTRFYWQADMLTAQRLHKLEIVSRLGNNGLNDPNTRRYFDVYAWQCASGVPSCSNMNGSGVAGLKKLATVGPNNGDAEFAFKETWSTLVNDATPYRYLRIVKTVPEYFYLNEVKIYRAE